MSLAFLLGLLGQLGETIGKPTVRSPADVAEELKPNTPGREQFLESAIVRAREFLTNNHSKFQSWQNMTLNSSNRPTNSFLANSLAELANRDIVEFFTRLDRFPTSLGEEVCQTV